MPSLTPYVIFYNRHVLFSAFLQFPICCRLCSFFSHFPSSLPTPFQYLHMAWGVSPMMKVVFLVWCTLLLAKLTGWSTLGLSSLTAEGQGGLSGGLDDRLWYNQEHKTFKHTKQLPFKIKDFWCWSRFPMSLTQQRGFKLELRPNIFFPLFFFTILAVPSI